ncbi:carbohydrate ABC transporter permease [Arthrobacter sp. W4I7]|uniref:carbohydrate ABC transporter permease n=1 Tax=Arthrobacter sp. W4I7 TaxID=3042296 RepID=UPI0027838AFB|nr:sugar ABC transporter permease [Arthrobacter sp. W4I7]MDQ0693137.1 raffinose/stachyose/melibiose transport system permease protein [Arthrobacter sp. W4I7]
MSAVSVPPIEHQREMLTDAIEPKESRKRRGTHISGRSKLGATGFILPAYFFYAGFLLIPLLLTILLSFTSWNGVGYNSIQPNGVKNYIKLANDPVFLQALLHNGIFLATTVILKVILAFMLALALRRVFPGAAFFRAVFVIPSILSLIVVSLLLKFLVDPNNGLINPLLRSIGLGNLAGSWLGDPNRALPLLIGLDVWLGFGLFLFVFLAGMSALPGEVTEAAKVDGANSWQETWYVTTPLLAPTFRLVVLLGAIESLKVFATVYVATSGGPNHGTEVLASWAFFQAFTGNQVGYGSAIMSVLLVATLILAVFYVRANQKGNVQ